MFPHECKVVANLSRWRQTAHLRHYFRYVDDKFVVCGMDLEYCRQYTLSSDNFPDLKTNLTEKRRLKNLN